VVAVVCLFCLLFGDLLQLRSLELSGHEILHLISRLACSSGKDKIWRCDQAAVATDCLLIEAFSLWVHDYRFSSMSCCRRSLLLQAYLIG